MPKNTGRMTTRTALTGIVVTLIALGLATYYVIGSTTANPSEVKSGPPVEHVALDIERCGSFLTKEEFEKVVQPDEELIVEHIRRPMAGGDAFRCFTTFSTVDGKTALFLNVVKFGSEAAANQHFDMALMAIKNIGGGEIIKDVIGERTLLLPSREEGVWGVLVFVKGDYVVSMPTCGTSPHAELHAHVATLDQMMELARIVEAKLP